MSCHTVKQINRKAALGSLAVTHLHLHRHISPWDWRGTLKSHKSCLANRPNTVRTCGILQVILVCTNPYFKILESLIMFITIYDLHICKKGKQSLTTYPQINAIKCWHSLKCSCGGVSLQPTIQQAQLKTNKTCRWPGGSSFIPRRTLITFLMRLNGNNTVFWKEQIKWPWPDIGD